MKEQGEKRMNEDTTSREKLIYSATPNSHSDLVTGMSEELTKEDIWGKISELLDIGHWATNRQLQIWVRGFATDRYSTIEKLLKQKVKRGDLREDHYGKPKVYARPMKTRGAPKRYRPYLYHEFSCTEFYIRCQKSKRGIGIPPGGFRGIGVIPDFGIKYDRSILLGEFETERDTEYHKRLEGKVDAYKKHISDIEEAFSLTPHVIFILDIPRDKLWEKIVEVKPSGRIYF